ncbi:putative dehydrogenase [Arthrobacter stackebrandtii]|uniref:Dehydrogenase n=1 Tax=Arthrobacter stackebrandtii TaxID=272161 RepID=A0ABS4YSH2_9MICC|nr:Gfo/Idh/MocA family oxidoreductase [Arthrobacter stackebrandtii]MBP2411704.1 putative dehydrogenase [Arthrobacter stackebrandtii]PYG99720.1 oxidoreductase [Arthrobacter stackebrandtii]
MSIQRFVGRPDWYDTFNPETLAATGTTLRWGVVATGGIARTVTADLALLEDAELLAVSSRSEKSAAAFAGEFGFARHYYDGGPDGLESPGYMQLVADPDVDVVYIATPHAQHFDIAKAALEHGKHVLCEKALTITAAEARVLIALAREKQLFLMEAVWARFVPGFQRAMEIVASGEIGEVKWVRADLGFPAPVDDAARIWAPADGGGALLDITVYPLLWAWGTLGAPTSLHAAAELTPLGVDAQNVLNLSYPSGAQAQLISYLGAHGPRTASVAGSKGFIETVGSVNNPKGLRVSVGWDGERVETFEHPGSGYTYQLREVTRCIQAGLTESTTMPLDDSLAVMELFDDARRQFGVSYWNDTRTDL